LAVPIGCSGIVVFVVWETDVDTQGSIKRLSGAHETEDAGQLGSNGKGVEEGGQGSGMEEPEEDQPPQGGGPEQIGGAGGIGGSSSQGQVGRGGEKRLEGQRGRGGT
jgi:hypothetical protein